MSNRWLNLLFFAAAPFLLVQNRAVAQSAPPLDPLSLTATASGEAAGDHLLVHGEFLAAISAYSTAPVDADTLNKIGVAWQHLSAVEQARKDYEMALLLRPNFAEALSNLASAYYVEKELPPRPSPLPACLQPRPSVRHHCRQSRHCVFR